MAKHKGQPKPSLKEAIDSAGQKALDDTGPGKYTLDPIVINVGHTADQADAGAAATTSPIRDYTATLDGPQ
jgi:hypothetical protein